jgi:hypothetical protein
MREATPSVVEVPLRKAYRFMYENFVVSTQHDLYLLLAKTGDTVDALKFDFTIFKYGSPNDEARGGHQLFAHGLGFYGLYEVTNSPWINELMKANRIHPMHQDGFFSDMKHYVACFKDVMLEIVCDEMHEVRMSVDEVLGLVSKELENLS